MDTNKETKKTEKKDEIIILDEGLTGKNIDEPLGWICCTAQLFPYRL